MRLVIQRVSSASVYIENANHASIGLGLLILLGIEAEDKQEDASWLCSKISGLRIFNDEMGKMNKNLQEVNGSILLISQFTLHAMYKKGNRPSFIRSAKSELAIPLYEYFISDLEYKIGKPVATGVFGADMKVEINNDGPVTILMDSKNPE